MGKLSIQQVPERIAKPSLAGELEKIKLHDQRACFHTEPTSNASEIAYIKKHLEWVKQIIDSKKFDVYEHLLTLPIETVDFTEGVLNELRKALNAQDKTVAFQTTSKEIAVDYENRLKSIKEAEFWENEAFTAMKSNINAVMIVDMPAIPYDANTGTFIGQVTKYPEPYYRLLDPCLIIDADVNRDGSIEWIIFKDEYVEGKYYAFDEDFYTTIFMKDGKVESYVQVPHFLTYCPARTFWTTPFNKDSKLQRKSPISNSLGKLDWLLFTYTSSKHLGLYAGFPIYVMYEQKCTYQDTQGNACVGGYVHKSVRNGHSDTFVESTEPCPTCKDKKLLGPGSVLTAPAPADNDDPDLLQGVNVIPAEKGSLEWMQSEIDRQELGLTWKMIGVAKEVSEAAKNEMQVSSGFESRLNVIIWVKQNFEIIRKWTLDTMGKLRYGSAYMGSTVNYGKKFFVYDFADLLAEFKESKSNGMPGFELSQQIDQLMNVKYQGNPEQLQRSKILKELEPYAIYSIAEVKNFPGLPDDDLLTLKKNFDYYIAKFEREFTNVVNFLPYAEVEEKIEFIRTELLKYVAEDVERVKAAQPKEEAVPGGGTFK